MKDIERDIYQGAFRLWNYKPGDPSGNYGPSGSLYTFDNDTGHGEYWVHFHGNLFAVNAYEMTFDKPGSMRYTHAEHLSICLYEDMQNMEADGYHAEAGAVSVYIAENGREYVGRYKAGAHVKATSITISPDYYRDYLQQRFGSIPDVREAFAKVDGRKDFPELVSLFKRVRDYLGDGMAADLFYEGAVAEAVGLVIDKAAALDEKGIETSLGRDDIVALDNLESYVRDRLGEDITVAQLAQQVCMGLTKFNAAFKSRYWCTPAAYVQSLRMEHACELLEKTDLPIAAIAQSVGYHKQSAFGQTFKRTIGVLPSAYRKRQHSISDDSRENNNCEHK